MMINIGPLFIYRSPIMNLEINLFRIRIMIGRSSIMNFDFDDLKILERFSIISFKPIYWDLRSVGTRAGGLRISDFYFRGLLRLEGRGGRWTSFIKEGPIIIIYDNDDR